MRLQIEPKRTDDVQIPVKKETRLGIRVLPCRIFFAQMQAVEKKGFPLRRSEYQRNYATAVKRRLLNDRNGKAREYGPERSVQGLLQELSLILCITQEKADENRIRPSMASSLKNWPSRTIKEAKASEKDFPDAGYRISYLFT